jgi:integrase/recombinase XerD
VVDIQPGLASLLVANQPVKLGFLFPGGRPGQPMTRFMADKLLKKACECVGLLGVSTHSFRRTALTQMSSTGIPLRHIQEISAHNNLGTLPQYLEV